MRHIVSLTGVLLVLLPFGPKAGDGIIPVPGLGLEGGKVLKTSELRIPEIMMGNEASCEARAIEAYEGKLLGISAPVRS